MARERCIGLEVNSSSCYRTRDYHRRVDIFRTCRRAGSVCSILQAVTRICCCTPNEWHCQHPHSHFRSHILESPCTVRSPLSQLLILGNDNPEVTIIAPRPPRSMQHSIRTFIRSGEDRQFPLGPPLEQT